MSGAGAWVASIMVRVVAEAMAATICGMCVSRELKNASQSAPKSAVSNAVMAVFQNPAPAKE